LLSFFDPDEFPGRVSALGYRVLENLSPAQQNERYFANRSDDLGTFSGTYYLRVAIDATGSGPSGVSA